MVDAKTGSFHLMKSLNRSLILNIIRQFKPISRAEIAKQTNLTPPTVGNLVKELISSNIVLETNLGQSNGGRKPQMLVINTRNFYIAGLDIGPKNIKFIITDLNATIIDNLFIELKDDMTNQHLLELITQGLETLFNKNTISKEHFIGIGVGMHGIVDVKSGIALYAPNLQLKNIPIKEHLEFCFNMTVKVENDVRAMALGEAWFGAGQGAKSIVCINIGHGIGSGILNDGKLFHGEASIAGEIGHMTIDIGGPRCSCGNYGCLQSLAAGPYIAEKAAKEISIGRNSFLTQMTNGDLSLITAKMIYQAALKGDGLSIDLLSQTGVYLGIGLTNLIHILNPERIIIGGGVSKAEHFIMDSLRKTIKQRALTTKAKHTEILLSMLGDQATAIGATSLLLNEIFSEEYHTS